MVMMMMDLNMSSASEEEESSAAAAAAEKSTVDDSGSSISSEDCRYLGFRFGILKEQHVEETSMSLFTTRQLFPMEIGVGSSSSTSSAVDFNSQQQLQQPPQQPKKVRRGPRSRSSQYRGVTFYRRTGRWESHIWDCGKQVYLGGFDTADAAARAYDRAAIKFRGVEADINFTLSDYKEDLMQTSNLTKEEFVHALRRQSTGFARGTSKYRGVMRPHKCGRLEAQTGQLLGNKYIYLGLSDNKIESARAYDKATIKYDGRDVVVSSESISRPEVAIEAIGHDLDLNLRISQPDNTSPKRRNNPMGIQVHFGSFEHSEAKKARSNNASIAGGQSHGLAMAPEPPQAWTALYPGLFPRTEGKSSREKT